MTSCITARGYIDLTPMKFIRSGRRLTMPCSQSDLAKRMEQNIGEYKTLGAQDGGKMDSSALLVGIMIAESNPLQLPQTLSNRIDSKMKQSSVLEARATHQGEENERKVTHASQGIMYTRTYVYTHRRILLTSCIRFTRDVKTLRCVFNLYTYMSDETTKSIVYLSKQKFNKKLEASSKFNFLLLFSKFLFSCALCVA